MQPNGPIDEANTTQVDGVELRPVLAQSFGCPCHGGLYDAEGNRQAGPPVRSMDRYEYKQRMVATLNVYYSARLGEGTLEPADDVAELRWFAPDDVPVGELAFGHITEVLSAWRNQNA